MDCQFLTRNPFTGNLAQHSAPATQKVVVALVSPGGKFHGEGVETNVCDSCAQVVEERYQAVFVKRLLTEEERGT